MLCFVLFLINTGQFWKQFKKTKTVEQFFQMLDLMDSFYLPGQMEMSLNTKGTGTQYLGCILRFEISADSGPCV